MHKKIYSVESIFGALRRGDNEIDGIKFNRTFRKRMRTFIRYGPMCYYCQRPGTHFEIKTDINGKYLALCALDSHRGLTIDHVIPTSLGGPDSLKNKVPACGECNSKKGSILNWKQPRLFATVWSRKKIILWNRVFRVNYVFKLIKFIVTSRHFKFPHIYCWVNILK